jgi:hypothetical protein
MIALDICVQMPHSVVGLYKFSRHMPVDRRNEVTQRQTAKIPTTKGSPIIGCPWTSRNPLNTAKMVIGTYPNYPTLVGNWYMPV